MGSSMAPTFANIRMVILERKLLNEAPQGLIPIEWIIFIDDIFDKVQGTLSTVDTEWDRKIVRVIVAANCSRSQMNKLGIDADSVKTDTSKVIFNNIIMFRTIT